MPRLPAKESPRARSAYSLYERLGPQRSLEKVAQELAKSLPLIKRWSAAHAWQERVRAYDAQVAQEAEERARAERLAQQEAFRKARLGLSAEMQKLGIEAARLNAQRDKIGAHAAVQMITAGADMQRKDLGEPDQRVEVGGPDGGEITVRVIYDDADNVGGEPGL